MKKNKLKSISFLVLGSLLFVQSNVLAKSNIKLSKSSLTEYELKIWNDPSFKKRFTESYIAATEIEPRVTSIEREQMQKVLNLISSNEMDKAVSMLKRFQNKEANALYDFTLANIYFQQEKYDQAAQNYEIALEKYPKFRRAWRNIGLIHVRKGDFAKALPALTRVVELGGVDSLTYGLLGFAYSSAGNYLAAETAYRMAILVDSKNIDWKMGLARSLFKQQRFAEAVALCGRLITENPDSADLWLLQANAYIGLNQPMKAAQNYEFVDSLKASTVESLLMLGDIYINQELYEMAVNSYLRAIKKDSSKSLQRVVRAAKVLAARSAFKETERLIINIKELDPSLLNKELRKDMLKLQARIAVSNGEGKKQVKILKEIVSLDPLDGEALILLGQHCEREQNIEQAIFYYERAASIDKYEADAKIRYGQLLVKQAKYDDALPLLRRAQQINPRDNVAEYIEQVERASKSK